MYKCSDLLIPHLGLFLQHLMKTTFQKVGSLPSSRKQTFSPALFDSPRQRAPSLSPWQSALLGRPTKARGDWQPAQCVGNVSMPGIWSMWPLTWADYHTLNKVINWTPFLENAYGNSDIGWFKITLETAEGAGVGALWQARLLKQASAVMRPHVKAIFKEGPHKGVHLVINTGKSRLSAQAAGGGSPSVQGWKTVSPPGRAHRPALQPQNPADSHVGPTARQTVCGSSTFLTEFFSSHEDFR